MKTKLFLIDTSVWITVLKKNPPDIMRDRIEHLLLENVVAITPVIKVELLGGTRNELEFQRLQKRLESLILFDINAELWDKTARLAYDLRRKGVTIPHTDTIIASVALQYNATLLHLDKHYDIIAGQTSLKAEKLLE
ncbi:MAG: PIN domain nuclease [bacterium]|nr:PIN domain nuclease [bacterium]